VVQGAHGAFIPKVVLECHQLVVGARTLHGFVELMVPLFVERRLFLCNTIVLHSLFSDDCLRRQWCLFTSFSKGKDLGSTCWYNSEYDGQSIACYPPDRETLGSFVRKLSNQILHKCDLWVLEAVSVSLLEQLHVYGSCVKSTPCDCHVRLIRRDLVQVVIRCGHSR